MTENAIQNRPGWGISLHWVTVISLLYLALPCMLFFSSWFTPWVAWPVNLGILLTLYTFARKRGSNQQVWVPGSAGCMGLLFAATVCAASFFSSGLAGYITPHPDILIFREALYNNLIQGPWPLVLPDGKEMSYYLAGMLPPALMARLTEDFTLQRVLALLWYTLGTFLSLLLFFCRNQRFSLLFVLFIVAFKDPVYIIINSFAGTGDVWNAVGQFIPLPENHYRGIPETFATLSKHAQGYNFIPCTLLTSALIINVAQQRHILIPLCISLLIPSSPLGATGCSFLGIAAIFQQNKYTLKQLAASALLPFCICFLCAVYYCRVESATCIGLHGTLQGNWQSFLCNYYLGIFLSTTLIGILIWPHVKADILVQVSLFCSLVLPWIYFGSTPESGIFGNNELWLKTGIIFHSHLIAIICFSWAQLKWYKYAWLAAFIILNTKDILSTKKKPTHTPVVSDVWNGHLHHQHPSLYQKLPHCHRSAIHNALLLQGGEAEQNFPGTILPKAKGCDYSRPMQPDGVHITH